MTDEENPYDPKARATQTKCPACFVLHYPTLVEEISNGEKGCEFCSRPASRMTNDEYAKALTEGRRALLMREEG